MCLKPFIQQSRICRLRFWFILLSRNYRATYPVTFYLVSYYFHILEYTSWISCTDKQFFLLYIFYNPKVVRFFCLFLRISRNSKLKIKIIYYVKYYYYKLSGNYNLWNHKKRKYFVLILLQILLIVECLSGFWIRANLWLAN